MGRYGREISVVSTRRSGLDERFKDTPVRATLGIPSFSVYDIIVSYKQVLRAVLQNLPDGVSFKLRS